MYVLCKSALCLCSLTAFVLYTLALSSKQLTFPILCLSADISDLFEVHSELYNVAARWKGLGLALRLHPGSLDNIETDCRDVQSCLREVLTQWLKRAYNTNRFGAPSWQLLVTAVDHPAGGNHPALAQTIALSHNGRFSHAASWRTENGNYICSLEFTDWCIYLYVIAIICS